MRLTRLARVTGFLLPAVLLTGCGSESQTATDSSTDTSSNDLIVFSAQPAASGFYPQSELTGEPILGNKNFPAISYGAWRTAERKSAETGFEIPTVAEQMEDMKILSAMGYKVLRTYNTQKFTTTQCNDIPGFTGEKCSNTDKLMAAIKLLKEQDSNFEMYVMLGIWIDALNSWTGNPVDHTKESPDNANEMTKAIELAKQYPEIVKVLAVGNEAMVHWATSYFVTPDIILGHVKDLQQRKESGELNKNIWVTSSDNFASWTGTGDYTNPDLDELIKTVDYLSIHVYPFHDTHYDADFWKVPANEQSLSDQEKIDKAMVRAQNKALGQLKQVQDYMLSLGVSKQIHVGETGWATQASPGGADFTASGSGAADEYKQKAYYDDMKAWSEGFGASLFFFQAFDEPWKGGNDLLDPEKHFGLIDIDGKAKYVAWDMVDQGMFTGLTRGNKSISKSFDGNKDEMMKTVSVPPAAFIAGGPVTTPTYSVSDVVASEGAILNGWEGTAGIGSNEQKEITVTTGAAGASWWGAGIEVANSGFVNLSNFSGGSMQFEIRGTTASSFNLGFQTGRWSDGSQVNNFVVFGDSGRVITADWVSHTIPMSELKAEGANLADVTGLLAVLGISGFDGGNIEIRNIVFSQSN